MPPHDDLVPFATAATAVLDPESTAMLLSQVRAGDEDAMNRLLARCLPSLQRWAHGRLPANARDANETADVVQEAVISTLRQLGHFEARREGALQVYLRTAVARRIIDLIRRRRRLHPRVDCQSQSRPQQ